ncbi:MAG: hypothetical protein JO246_13745, partial [Frankiaceae bacterium]|nr:hypothetical protein [Frankiaceae bacterium]
NNFGTLNNLAEMSPTDLLNTFLTVSGYINQLTQSNLLNIEFPLTNGATIGQVINFASEFGTDVLTKLGSVQDMIGINHAAQSATAGSAGGTAVVELTPGDFSHLPQNFDIVLQVDGKILDFHLTPPTVSGNGAASDLSTELNALLPSVLTAAGINPNDPNDFFHNVLTIAANGSHVDFTAKATGDTHNFANISIQTPGTSFTTLPTFAENLAFALGYGGVASTLQSLAAGIGLQYDGGSSTLQFQLNYSTALPASLNSLGFDGAHRIAADDGSGHIVVAAQATVADFTSAFSFNLVINGHNREIDVAADLSRSTADAVATAIQNALNAVLVNPTDLGLAAGNSFTLGSKITVTADGNHHVTFTATTSALTPANITTTPLLALADVHAENFSVGFDLGSLGGLAVSNGSFSFDATAGISMTIGVKIPPANQTAVTTGTELDLIPIWPTGGSITADQANNPVVVARSDIGLGGVFNGPSAATVEPIGDFIQASLSGTNLVLSALVTNATSSIAPASGQAATLSIVDAGAVSSSTQGGIADLGFAGQASSNDGTHITLTSGAISDVTKEFIFSLVVNGHAVKVDVPRDTGRASVGDLVIAINHALGAATGFPDLRVYLRDGSVTTIEFNAGSGADGHQSLIVSRVNANGTTTAFPVIAGSGVDGNSNPTHKVTIGDLLLALDDAGKDPNNLSTPSTVTAVLDPTSEQIKITDSSTPNASYKPPEVLGFATSQAAVAQQAHPGSDPTTDNYIAVLTNNPQVATTFNPSLTAPDFSHDTQFLLSIGTLAPKLIKVTAPTTHDATDYATAINNALAQVSFTRAELGLSGSGTVALSTIVTAAGNNTTNAITLT